MNDVGSHCQLFATSINTGVLDDAVGQEIFRFQAERVRLYPHQGIFADENDGTRAWGQVFLFLQI